MGGPNNDSISPAVEGTSVHVMEPSTLPQDDTLVFPNTSSSPKRHATIFKASLLSAENGSLNT